MIINAREWAKLPYEEWRTHKRCRVFADGVEVKQAWYVDTDFMIVKTYDVLGDGKAHLASEVPSEMLSGLEILRPEFPGYDTSCPDIGWRIASKTIKAKTLELRAWEDD